MGNTCCTISPILRESMKRRHGEPVVNRDVNKFIAHADLAIDSCAICLEPMKRGERIFLVKCGHMYHGYCLVKWSQRKSTCPLCNLDIKI